MVDDLLFTKYVKSILDFLNQMRINSQGKMNFDSKIKVYVSIEDYDIKLKKRNFVGVTVEEYFKVVYPRLEFCVSTHNHLPLLVLS